MMSKRVSQLLSGFQSVALPALIAMGALMAPMRGWAQDVPATMTVQGVLRDDAGVPVDATVTLHFSLQDGGTVLWSESHTEVLRAGLFSITLGSVTPIEASFFATLPPPELVVSINDGLPLAPIALTSVAYAFRAQSAAIADSYPGDVSWGQLTDVPAGFADGTDDGNSYVAGRGLSLTTDTFAVDPAAVQSRITGSCTAGEVLVAVAEDGSVTCRPDADTDTTYGAGAGLLLAGTTFSVNTSTIQARVAGTCPAGQSIRAIAASGTVTCEVDTDTDTTYGAGVGLLLAGTTFSVNTSTIQARVAGSCPVGQAIRAVALDGTVTCQGLSSLGQTWQNLTASRAFGVSYINATGRTIMVNVTHINGILGANQSQLAVDGLVVCEQMGYAGGHRFTCSALVAPGSTYGATGSSTSLFRWSEFR